MGEADLLPVEIGAAAVELKDWVRKRVVGGPLGPENEGCMLLKPRLQCDE